MMNGFTKEEQYLNALGSRSFLQFWSWPNLFRDQGDVTKHGDGKEICDLIVVFDKDIILFSDKKIKFNLDKDVEIAWARWARKAIGESAKQLDGARRWLQKYPDRIYTDKSCTNKIPIEIPIGEDVVFHHIVVSHGIEEVIGSFNVDSSFMFDNHLKGNDNWNKGKAIPFCIGEVEHEQFIHVFNEYTIGLVLEEFDTIKDFIHYLGQRESLFSLNGRVRINSESSIIGLYYNSFDEATNERVIVNNEMHSSDCIIIDGEGISDLYNTSSFKYKNAENKISYFWDDLIEAFTYHILNDSTEYTNYLSHSEAEEGIRELARSNRFERRILAETFFEFYNKLVPLQRGTRLMIDPYDSTKAYLFFAFPEEVVADNKYRDLRRELLGDYCVINLHLNRGVSRIYGIGFKTRRNASKLTRNFFNEGQDFVSLKVNELDVGFYSEAEKLHDKYVEEGLLGSRERLNKTSNEFPEIRVTKVSKKLKGSLRNQPCTCGSGLKIKKCCGI